MALLLRNVCIPYHAAFSPFQAADVLLHRLTLRPPPPQKKITAGPKATSLQVLPGASDTLSWHLVPTHSGALRLPNISLEAPGLGHSVEAARGCDLFVERPPS